MIKKSKKFLPQNLSPQCNHRKIYQYEPNIEKQSHQIRMSIKQPSQPKRLDANQRKTVSVDRKLYKIVKMNQQYFQDKLRVTNLVKPSRYRFKMPYKTGCSVYKKSFENKSTVNIHKIINKTYETKMTINAPFNDLTNYKENYQQYSLPKKQPINRNSYNVNDDAQFFDTQYQLNYPNWCQDQTRVPIRPKSAKLLFGGSFKGISTYKSQYKNSKTQQIKPYITNNFPIFNDIRSPLVTTYNNFYDTKSINRQNSCKNNDKYIGDGKLGMYSTSEYKTSFNKKLVNEQVNYDPLTVKQMQTRIFNM